MESVLTLPEKIKEGMQLYDKRFAESLSSEADTIVRASEHVVKNSGKRLRPLLLMTVASAYGAITEEVVNGAVFIEQLHVSTLLHDDVVDESLERRGQPSLNAVYGNKKAVLVGDYILANAMISALMTGEKAIVHRLAFLGKQLTEGELMQMDAAELLDTSESFYYKVIERKTASLIKVSMEIGAILAGVESEEVISRLGEAGRLLGLAFQIRDDIFDYMPTNSVGKPAGNDLKEHKMTLPLIFALNKGTQEAQKALRVLRHSELSPEQIRFLVAFTRKSGGIEYAEEKMAAFSEEAKSILKEVLPQGEALELLLEICDYIIEREK